MKKLCLLIFALVSLVAINSCKKDTVQSSSPTSNNGVIAEKTAVKTYEIINLVSHRDLSDKYAGTFGNTKIELLKTSDSTLTFFVPDVASGEQFLDFELSKIKFDVTKSPEIDADQMVVTLFEKFDAEVAALNPTTSEETDEVNEIKAYKQEVLSLFNSLSAEEKRQTALFYEANKAVFKSFSNNVSTNINASTVFNRQSDCPRTDFKEFYGCTATNLGNSAIDLKNSSREFITMLTLAGLSAYLAPASFGLSAFGTTLALGTAGYLLITEVKPAFHVFKRALFPFIKANWIFTKALFEVATETFSDQISTSLNLKPSFRSITSFDGDVNPGSGYFISAMVSLNEYWNKLSVIFGNFPAYSSSEEPTTLETNDIKISNISNSKVQYLGNTGQSLKFKSLTGNEESFSYTVSVTKQGFVEEKRLNGTVIAAKDSTEIYRTSALGNYTVNGFVGNGPNSRLYCELKTENSAIYTIYDDPSWPDGQTFSSNWMVRRINNEYFITTSFTNPGHLIDEARKLDYEVSSFVYRHTYVK